MGISFAYVATLTTADRLMVAMSHSKTALVIVMSEIPRDPRVRRQIDWLADAGWSVDTIGLGDRAENVRDHFALTTEPAWLTSRFGTAVIYGLFSHRRKFKTLTQNQIPAEAQRRVKRGDYDLIIFNDRHFVPWVTDRATFAKAATSAHVHLDLHEYFVPQLAKNTLWQRVTAPYYAWSRHLFADPIFTTRSTVNKGISALYERELSIAPLTIVRNSPSFADLKPGAVDPDNIKLIHHGIANWDRGLREIIDAMRLLDDRFSVTFMLLGSVEVISALREYAVDLGSRVAVVPAVPMRDLSATVNKFDLEVMYYRPKTRNLELALPNKLFEAVQGRLGLVIGESPMMVDVVHDHTNGIVVKGWTAEDLAATLTQVTAGDVTALKEASHRAARSLSAESERSVFMKTVTGSDT